MPSHETCPECGAIWQIGVTCQDYFHQMLYWENEDPQKGIVHHLMVLGYHLQHPSLYSPEGLVYGLRLLVDFVEQNVSPQQVRTQVNSTLNSGQRAWKIRGKPGSQGEYKHPVHWRMKVLDVMNTGADHYIDSVQQLAHLILADLRSAGNLQ